MITVDRFTVQMGNNNKKKAALFRTAFVFNIIICFISENISCFDPGILMPCSNTNRDKLRPNFRPTH